MTLVVLAGQSNALGWSDLSALPPELSGPQPQVRIWNAQTGAFEVMQAGVNTGDVEQPQQAGAELAFAYAWTQAHPGEILYLVKAAQSSTGLAADPYYPDWSPSSGELYATATARIHAAEAASGQPVGAILWMQGEQDAGSLDKADAYQANLADLFAAMRRDWGDAATPIVYGRISEATGQPFAQLVRDAQDAVDRADPLAVDIDTDAFSMRADNLHYDNAGLAALGRAFFYADQTLAAHGLGGDAADTLQGSAGYDYLRGGAGNDLLLGGAGFDDLNGNMGDDTVHGGAGGDWVLGGKDNDLLFGDDGDDLVFGQLGSDTLSGGAGDDGMAGGQGNDVLDGGDGADYLSGDRGDDTMTGGAGADTFHSFGEAGLDVVTDFNAREGDRVQLDPGTAYTVSQAGPDVEIDMAGGGRLILQNVQLAALPPGWLVLA